MAAMERRSLIVNWDTGVFLRQESTIAATTIIKIPRKTTRAGLELIFLVTSTDCIFSLLGRKEKCHHSHEALLRL